MIQSTEVTPAERDYGTMYEALLTLNPNPTAFERIVKEYRHQQVVKRLTWIGGGLGFVLICLGAGLGVHQDG